MKKRALKFAFFGCVLLGVISNSQAGSDYTALPGAVCQPYFGTDIENLTWEQGTIGVFASTWATIVMCPIPRMRVTGDLNLVRVNGNNYQNDTTSIGFHMESKYGVSGAYVSKSASGTGDWQVDFSDSELPDIDYYYYYLAITLPEGSHIYRIWYDEEE